MQWSTDIRQIKAAIFDQAFIGRTWVSCPMGRVVGIRRRKGQLLALIYGWGRWYPVEGVLIVAAAASPGSTLPSPYARGMMVCVRSGRTGTMGT
jgi:hypothetical protein